VVIKPMPDTVTHGFPKNAEQPVEDFVMDYLPPFSLATGRQCLHQ